MTGTALSGRKYKAYPEYRDTELCFLEKIPKAWSTSKVRFISSFGRGLTITKANLKDTGVPCVSYGEVHSKYGFEIDPLKHQLKCVDKEYLESSPYALLSKGDFIFADTSEDIEGSGNFTQLISDEVLFAGYHTVVIRPNITNYYRFLAYLFDSTEFRTQVRDAVKGVKVFSVTQAILKNISIWLPEYNEQQKIANFLDHETAKIDTLIAKKEKLIELLKEKRQAVISHAVTKGLNPNAPMRESGVEWLGEVPEHWDVAPIKFISTYNDDSLSDITDEDYQIEYIDIGSVSAVNGVEKTEMLTFGNAPSRARRKLQAGDVIVSTVRTYLEAIAVIDSEKNNLVASTGFCVIRPTKIKEHFAGFALRTRFFIAEVIARSTGISYPAINSSDLVNIKIAYPSEQEQKDINQFVKNQCLIFDSLTEKATNAISLLKERKTALISAAVTGKIDVRDWKF